jgi:hypothetical protein
MTIDILNTRHPTYLYDWQKWETYRLCYNGGDIFRDQYLLQFSQQETAETFAMRKKISPIPAFAKAAVKEVMNSVFQRASDIIRKGGSPSYSDAIFGKNDGVDLRGSTMNSFISQNVLGELLALGKVGVFVDNAGEIGPTLADKGINHPYLYTYHAEDILNWSYKGTTLTSVLLETNNYDADDETGLPLTNEKQYWLLNLRNNGVDLKIYNFDNTLIKSVHLNLPMIPFTILELNDSLLSDTASYQIAMLNLASSDMFYAYKSNFPTYTEQIDGRTVVQNKMKKSEDGEKAVAGEQVIETGTIKGRTYPIGAERPGYIHPSPEPLRASMDKQERMKEDIRQLTALSLSSIRPKVQSAESKGMDSEGLEAGLSSIGFVLETAEREICKIWSAYENDKADYQITYPRKYTIKSDSQILDEAERKEKVMIAIPSITFQKEMVKDIAQTTIGYKISPDTMAMIEKEIEESPVAIVQPEVLAKDAENGLVGIEFASMVRGYPKGQVEAAKKDHADKLARISQYQNKGGVAENGEARGMGKMMDGNAKDEKTMSQNKVQNAGKTTRGPAK